MRLWFLLAIAAPPHFLYLFVIQPPVLQASFPHSRPLPMLLLLPEPNGLVQNPTHQNRPISVLKPRSLSHQLVPRQVLLPVERPSEQ